MMCTKFPFILSAVIPLSVATLLAMATLSAPKAAHAQACCAATGAGEFAVVGPCQKAVLGAQLSVEHGLGTFSEQGEFRTLTDARINDMILSVGGGVHVYKRSLQVYGSAPMRLQYRAWGSESGELSPGLGDISGGVRWTVLDDTGAGISAEDPGSFIPYVDLFVGLKAPTGRAPDQSESRLGADVTGDGFWAPSAGIKATKFLTPNHVLSLNAAVAYPLARAIDIPGAPDSDFRRGIATDLGVSYLYLHNIFWSWGLASTMKFEGESTLNGHTLAHSDTHRLRFGGHVTHGFSFPFWEASLSVMLDAWWDGAASNIPFVGPAVTLGVRRQFL